MQADLAKSAKLKSIERPSRMTDYGIANDGSWNCFVSGPHLRVKQI